MKTRAEIACQELGFDIKDFFRYFIVVPKVKVLETKIDASRMLMNIAHFNEGGCRAGLRCLQQYRRKTVKKTGAVLDQAEKLYSHGADAFGELAMVMKAGQMGNMNSMVGSPQKIITKPGWGDNKFFKDVERLEKARRMNRKPYSVLGGY